MPSEQNSSPAHPDRNESDKRTKNRPKRVKEIESPRGLSPRTDVLLARYVEQLIECDLAHKNIKKTAVLGVEKKKEKGVVELGKVVLEVTLENPIRTMMGALFSAAATIWAGAIHLIGERIAFGIAGLIAGIFITYAVYRICAVLR